MSEKKLDIIIEIILILFAIIVFIPIYYLLVTTFKSPEEAMLFPLSLPNKINFKPYVEAFKTMNYPRVLMNNLIITITSVTGIVLFSSMAAYSIARSKVSVTKAVYWIFLAGIMIPFQMGIVSLFKLVNSLHLMNTLTGIIFINIASNIVVALFLVRGFITTTIPIELEEAAFIDGCGTYRTFFIVVLPILKPVMATVAIINSLNVWNDFMNPLLFLVKREKGIIILEIFRNVGQFSTNWTALFPMLVLGVLPLLIFYLFTQKYIIKGIASGALKG